MGLKRLFLLIFVVTIVQCQQDNTPLTSQPRIPLHLQPCYRNDLFERDNRLPMTPHILVEILRKVEESPNNNLNLQQFVTSLVHRFKQDGIIPAQSVGNINADILRYSPNGFNFHKHRVLLRSLIPGNGNQFPAGVLTLQEQCTLHFMLSASIETHRRGDEDQRCNQLAQYRSIRVPRDTENFEMKKTPEMELMKKKMHKKFGRYQVDEDATAADEEENAEEDPETANEDVEGDVGEVEAEDQSVVDNTNLLSQCPVENGVLQSPWGPFMSGTAVIGLAAGLENQRVPVRDLMGDHFQQIKFARQQIPTIVDNRFAATLAGDLAEAVLIQVPTNNIRVGASGAWNNTAIPNWYFLSSRENLEITDAEIRGGIDGLVLGMNINLWRQQAQTLRLSQIIDMYYSQRGMFGMTNEESAARACNRRNLYPTVAPAGRLQQETNAFTTVLDGEMQTRVQLQANSTARFSTQAVDNLNTYIANSLNDLSCTGTSTVVNDNTIWRAATDIYLFVDTNWPFRDISTMIGHLLNNLDVGRYGSSYTILNANDGQVIVNTTTQLTDMYNNWTQAIHSNQPLGFNLPNIMREMRNISRNVMNSERDAIAVGGRSMVALLIPHTSGNVNEEHTNFAMEQFQIFREEVPDLRFVFWTGGPFNRFERFVREPARDLFPLNINLQGVGGDSIQTVAFPVIHRIQQEPRRIINHRCGGDWQSQGQEGTTTSVQYIEPRGIAFYRLHPNYFFHAGGNRRLRIHGAGYAAITVCQSRRVERPRANMTSGEENDVICRSVNTDTVEIDLSNACDGHGMIHHCPPLFVSVEGARVSGTESLRCIDRECRFPDEAKFEIMGDNLGCFSNAQTIIASFSIIFIAIITIIF